MARTSRAGAPADPPSARPRPSRLRHRLLALAAALAAAAAGLVVAGRHSASQAPEPGQAASPLPFVQACGTHFCAGGAELRVTGANSFPLLFRPECSPRVDQESIVRAASATGMTVLRFPLYQDLVLPWFDFSRLDHLIALAHRYHVYLLPYLEDENGLSADCVHDRPMLPVDWYAGGYTHVDTGHVVSYRDWVVMVLHRYHDEPAIFGWTLMSEPVAAGRPCDPAFATFFSTMTQVAHEVDGVHLVDGGGSGPGADGFACAGGPDTYAHILGLPHNDFAEYHDYATPPCPRPAGCVPAGLAAALSAGRAAGKPLLVAEMGISRDEPRRTAEIVEKFRTELGAGAAGVLLWQLQETPRGRGIDRYAVAVGDPLLEDLARLGARP